MMPALLALVAMALGPQAQAQSERCDNCGRVAWIKQVSVRESWTPLGAVAPGTPIAGQGAGAGQGRVNSAFDLRSGEMVLLGAAGGAGYAKRPSDHERPRWEIGVRMDGGSMRVVSHSYEPALREGDRVRVYGTQVELVGS